MNPPLPFSPPLFRPFPFSFPLPLEKRSCVTAATVCGKGERGGARRAIFPELYPTKVTREGGGWGKASKKWARGGFLGGGKWAPSFGLRRGKRGWRRRRWREEILPSTTLPHIPNLRKENISSSIPQQLSLTAASDSVDVFSGSAGAEGDDEINCRGRTLWSISAFAYTYARGKFGSGLLGLPLLQQLRKIEREGGGGF